MPKRLVIFCVVAGLLFGLNTSFAQAQETTTYYFSGVYEKTILPTGEEEITKYYPLPGGTTTVRKGPPGGGSLNYLHADHLASTRLMTNDQGLMTDDYTYYPYGSIYPPQRRAGNLQFSISNSATDRLYTAQILDDSTNLYFYNARQYNPTTAAFISADTAQGPNRYAYVGGNPISRNDPSGNAYDAETGGGGLEPLIPRIESARIIGPEIDWKGGAKAAQLVVSLYTGYKFIQAAKWFVGFTSAYYYYNYLQSGVQAIDNIQWPSIVTTDSPSYPTYSLDEVGEIIEKSGTPQLAAIFQANKDSINYVGAQDIAKLGESPINTEGVTLNVCGECYINEDLLSTNPDSPNRIVDVILHELGHLENPPIFGVVETNAQREFKAFAFEYVYAKSLGPDFFSVIHPLAKLAGTDPYGFMKIFPLWYPSK